MSASASVWRGVLRGLGHLGRFTARRSSGEYLYHCVKLVVMRSATVYATPRPRPYSISEQNGTQSKVLDVWSEVEQGSGTDWSEDEQREVPVSEQRSLRVALLGATNAGKSTLVNQLVQQKVGTVDPKK